MKKIIFLVVVLLLLLGAGVGVAMYLQIGPFAKNAEAKPEEKKDEAPKPAEGEGAAIPPKAVFYDAGSYIIPVVENHMITRQVGLDLSIEVDPKQSIRIGSELPRLQDAFVSTLFDTVPHYSDTKSAANKQAIHDRLLATANKMFGPGAVREVYIKSIYDR